MTLYNKEWGKGRCIFFYCSCSPKLQIIEGKINNGAAKDCNVFVFGKNEELPNDNKKIGKIQTKSMMFSKRLKVNETIELIKQGTCQLGGNAIRITEINYPKPFGPNSYDITADVLRTNNIPEKPFIITFQKDSLNNGNTKIKLLRKKSFYGSGVSIAIYMNDYYLGALNNGKKIDIALTKLSNPINLQAEFLGKLYNLKMNFEEGKTYYVKCTVKTSGVIMLEIISEVKGMKIFRRLKETPKS